LGNASSEDAVDGDIILKVIKSPPNASFPLEIADQWDFLFFFFTCPFRFVVISLFKAAIVDGQTYYRLT
jgi:hypothetical protein